jgi:hypothetical protein
LGFWGFKSQTTEHNNSQNCEKKKKVELTFRDFEVWNLRTSKAKTSTTTIPEMVNRKECGTKILGF